MNEDRRWLRVPDWFWTIYNRIVYRRPVGREGIDYKMVPRWRRRGS